MHRKETTSKRNFQKLRESPGVRYESVGRGFESLPLIYNDPLGYADLILNGDPEEYLKNVTGSHGLED